MEVCQRANRVFPHNLVGMCSASIHSPIGVGLDLPINKGISSRLRLHGPEEFICLIVFGRREVLGGRFHTHILIIFRHPLKRASVAGVLPRTTPKPLSYILI